MLEEVVGRQICILFCTPVPFYLDNHNHYCFLLQQRMRTIKKKKNVHKQPENKVQMINGV